MALTARLPVYAGATALLEPDLPVGSFCLLDVRERDLTDADIRGAALAPDAGSDRISLLKAVDAVLYQAKEAGRDRYLLR